MMAAHRVRDKAANPLLVAWLDRPGPIEVEPNLMGNSQCGRSLQALPQVLLISPGELAAPGADQQILRPVRSATHGFLR